MKVLGLLGGMSWESTVPYYRLINQGVRSRLGGLHSARLVLASVDFAQVEPLMRAGAWERAGEHLGDAALSLRAAGAQCVVLCTNTLHKVAPAIEARCGLPLLHIADAAAAAIRHAGVERVGLLGTRFTMEEEFYARRLAQRHGLVVSVPDADQRVELNRIVFEELCLGQVRDASRRRLREMIDRMAADGAQGMLLACTELQMLVEDGGETMVPLFDTTALHAQAAVEWALG